MAASYLGFRNYIKGFFVSGYKADEHGFEVYAKYYLENSGHEALRELFDEINKIETENSWNLFDTYISGSKNYLTTDELKGLAAMAVKVYGKFIKENEKARLRYGNGGAAASANAVYIEPGYQARQFYDRLFRKNKKHTPIMYIAIGLLAEIFVLILILTGAAAKKGTPASIIVWILGAAGIVLLIMGSIDLVKKRRK